MKKVQNVVPCTEKSNVKTKTKKDQEYGFVVDNAAAGTSAGAFSRDFVIDVSTDEQLAALEEENILNAIQYFKCNDVEDFELYDYY